MYGRELSEVHAKEVALIWEVLGKVSSFPPCCSWVVTHYHHLVVTQANCRASGHGALVVEKLPPKPKLLVMLTTSPKTSKP